MWRTKLFAFLALSAHKYQIGIINRCRDFFDHFSSFEFTCVHNGFFSLSLSILIGLGRNAYRKIVSEIILSRASVIYYDFVFFYEFSTAKISKYSVFVSDSILATL